MHRQPGSPSFLELLESLESSTEKWDESLPQEKFLKSKGEKKYFWSSTSGLEKFEEFAKHTEEFCSTAGGYDSKVGKSKGTGDSAEEQSKYPLYTELKKTAGEASTVSRPWSAFNYSVLYLLLFAGNPSSICSVLRLFGFLLRQAARQPGFGCCQVWSGPGWFEKGLG